MDIIKLATADFTRFLCFSGTDVNQCHHPSEFSHKGTGFVHHEADTLNREDIMKVAEILNVFHQNKRLLHVDQTQSLFTSLEYFSEGKSQINSWVHLFYKAGS